MDKLLEIKLFRTYREIWLLVQICFHMAFSFFSTFWLIFSVRTSLYICRWVVEKAELVLFLYIHLLV